MFGLSETQFRLLLRERLDVIATRFDSHSSPRCYGPDILLRHSPKFPSRRAPQTWPSEPLAGYQGDVTAKMKTQLSVVVPSYRRRDELDRCLEDLAAQIDPPSLEIVLVLQAFPAGAADSVRERFGGRLNLQIAEFNEGLGTGGARNEGLRMSSGEIVAFLDDDVRLPAGWSRALVLCYADPMAGRRRRLCRPSRPLQSGAKRHVSRARHHVESVQDRLGRIQCRSGVQSTRRARGRVARRRQHVVPAVGDARP